MNSISDWWKGEVDWSTPAGKLLQQFVGALPKDRSFEIALYGSAPLQLTVNKNLLSGDVDIFAGNDEDLTATIDQLQFGKETGGLHLEAGFELSFRTSPRWRARAKTHRLGNVQLLIPHPIDILIGKLDRLEPKDITAFECVIAETGHPTAEEFKAELQNAVDLYRPSFDEESPNRYLENTERLWREVFHSNIDVRKEIIAPAIARRKQGYGEPSLKYKAKLGQ
jgi:hypothetical protein